MKIVAIATFFFSIILFSTTTLAQLQYYGVDVKLDERGKSFVKFTLTFFQPVNKFNFTILGEVENLRASSLAGLVNCTVKVRDISYISCDLPLTEEKRTVEMVFETKDFTKPLGEKQLFSGNFNLNQKIEQFYLSLTLPEGMVLSDEGRLPFPENVTKVSDGRHIIVVWKLSDIDVQPLVFQILYEPVIKTSSLIWYFVGSIIAVSVATVLIIRKIRKPEEVILSVLDDYERSVMQAITQAGGEINQRRVVQQTNLSKAKVSRVVKALEERGLIKVERLGRTNKLKVVKKKI